jgi:hypothetical protein
MKGKALLLIFIAFLWALAEPSAAGRTSTLVSIGIGGLDSFMTVSKGEMYIAGGISNGTGIGGFDAVLATFEGHGRPIWVRAYGGPSWDILLEVIPTGDGFFGTGLSGSFGGGWIFKVDTEGNLVWSEVYSTGMISSATSIGDNLLAVAVGRDGPILIRISSKGDIISAYQVQAQVFPVKIVSLPDGSILIGGRINSSITNGEDFWLGKVFNGRLLWQRSYGFNGTEGLYDMEADASGATLVGYSVSNGRITLFVLRVDPDGKVLWSRRIKANGDIWANSVSITPKGDLIIGGTYYSPSEGTMAVLAVVDLNGNLKHLYAIGGSGYSQIWKIRTTRFGDILLAGRWNGKSSPGGHLISSNALFGILREGIFNFSGCNVLIKRPVYKVEDEKPLVWSGKGDIPLREINLSMKKVSTAVRDLKPSETFLCKDNMSNETTTNSEYLRNTSKSSVSPTASSITTVPSSSASKTTTTAKSSKRLTTTPTGWSICGPGSLIGASLVLLLFRRRR